ncbi:hypothetical protein Agabi119p4_8804 [Agaricus bisporus var. burnettii]|uniref:Uncharacterized protein n=1 Tax=Agaricus bisporus var. burnettii TaxID=192524 RepID=A0A8H7C4G6_AGABI|nr:hypothetical protein Agabi119p4_8804 [Agaricus bisporus var. burnettii]
MDSLDFAGPFSQSNFKQTSVNYVEVAAMMMPKRMTGIKHMLRPACKYLPMPMSMGWQDNPADDDYPQSLLIRGLQLTDVDSGATRAVIAPWMHALYRMSYENQPSGVTEIKLEDTQFAGSSSWQHKAVLGVLCFQCFLGFLAFARQQRREGTLILLGIFLQMAEGYYAWKYPTHRPPRAVAKARYYVLHKGMTSSHFLLISHRPQQISSNDEKPYTNLEDVAVPLSMLRKGYRRIQEACFRKLLQIANMGLKLGAVISTTNSLIVPFTLFIGTIASEIIISLHTPLPKYSELEPLQTADSSRSSILDMLVAISQKTGCNSVGFVESILPDPAGNHVDYEWIEKVLRSKGALFSGVHPTHQTATTVFATALRRATNPRS